MTFCLHDLPIKESSPGRSTASARKHLVPHAPLLLRLIENHLAHVQRLHGLLAKRVTRNEDHTGEMVLDYGIEPNPPDHIPALHLVASSPAIEPSVAVPFVPPPPPRLTPLAVAVLRKRLAMDPYIQTAVQINHTLPHILPSLSNRKVCASAQRCIPNHQSQPDRDLKLTTNL